MIDLITTVVSNLAHYIHLQRIGDEGALRTFLLVNCELAETIATRISTAADDSSVAIARAMLTDDAAWRELYQLLVNLHETGKRPPLVAADLGQKIIAALPADTTHEAAIVVVNDFIFLCQRLLRQ